MHIHLNALPCFVLITKCSHNPARFEIPSTSRIPSLPDVEPLIDGPRASRLVRVLQRELIIRGHLLRQDVLVVDICWSGVGLSATDDSKLDLVELFAFDAGALGQSLLGLLEDLAVFQKKDERHSVVFRWFLLVVETRNKSISRVSVGSAFLLWQAFGVDGHEFINVRNRVGLAEQFVNPS